MRPPKSRCRIRNMHLNLGDTTTPLAAFCAGMCGLLTCAMFGACAKSETAVYQGARVLAYSVLGGMLAVAGYPAARLFTSSPARLMPWAFALVFIALAFGLEKRIQQPAFISRIFLKLRFGSKNRTQFAALLGAVTPLFPCGPLYLLLGIALVSGSFFAGATLMASFALGTLPLYWLVQMQ